MPVTSWSSGTHPKNCSRICLITVAFIANAVHIYMFQSVGRETIVISSEHNSNCFLYSLYNAHKALL